MQEILNEIGLERARQIEKGHEAIGDDNYTGKQLGYMACGMIKCFDVYSNFLVPYDWTDFTRADLKRPASYRDALVKGAALVIAEIERLDRKTEREGGNEPPDIERQRFREMVQAIAKETQE